jgi:LAO/AO transport system kinase
MKQKPKTDSALKVNQGIEQPPSVDEGAAQRFLNIKRKKLTAEEYFEGLIRGDRTILSKAITLIESSLPEHQQMAKQIVEKCLPHSGKSIRIGISGVPGAGKSTFIEALGKFITSQNHQLAVLAIDPAVNVQKEAFWAIKPGWKN